MNAIDRWFMRCQYCERLSVVNIDNIDINAPNIEEVAQAPCPLCGEKELKIMGKVEKSDVVREGKKAPCDKRCTNASGPLCNCLCGEVNHGTYRLVTYNRVVGKLEILNKELFNENAQYLARIKRMAEAKNRIKQKVLAFLKFKYKDVIKAIEVDRTYLPWSEYDKYNVYRKFIQQIDKIEDYTSVQRKVNTLARMIVKIGTNLEYLEAMYEKQLEKVT